MRVDRASGLYRGSPFLSSLLALGPELAGVLWTSCKDCTANAASDETPVCSLAIKRTWTFSLALGLVMSKLQEPGPRVSAPPHPVRSAVCLPFFSHHSSPITHHFLLFTCFALVDQNS